MKIFGNKAFAKNSIFVKTQPFQENQSASSVFLMWRLTINVLYYFGVTPFKCEFSIDKGRWYLKSSGLHKVNECMKFKT